MFFFFCSNDSQLSTQSQTSLSLPPPQANNMVSNVTNTNCTLTHESNVIANGTAGLSASNEGNLRTI